VIASVSKLWRTVTLRFSLYVMFFTSLTNNTCQNRDRSPSRSVD